MKRFYKTKQKELILNLIKSKSKFTINEIYNDINQKVGLTTIYRLIDDLLKQNLIIKFIDHNNIYYQYIEKCEHDNHYYLKCNNCGTLNHIDCNCINELTKHIVNKHNFTVSKNNIVINGYCHNCQIK